MNVKIKARVAILKSYMTLLGFKDPTVYAYITHNGTPVRGKEKIELDRLEGSSLPWRTMATEVVITIRGYHTGLNNVLEVNKALPLELFVGSPTEYIHQILMEAKHYIHEALYEKAKAKAVIPAADLL